MKQYYTHIESVRREQVDLTKLAHAALRLAREQVDRRSDAALPDERDAARKRSTNPRRTRPEGRT